MAVVRIRVRRRALVLGLAVGAVHLSAAGADRHWVGGDPGGAFWHLAGNWSATSGGAGGAGKPANGDRAFIRSGLTLNLSRDSLAGAYAAPGLAELHVDNTSSDGGPPFPPANVTTLTLSAGAPALVAAVQSIGETGLARIVHEGGSNTAGTLTLGTGAGALGGYQLDGATSTLKVNTLTDVGSVGSGSFLHLGGTHTTPILNLGKGASGKYTMSGGTLTVANGEFVGLGRSGTLTQSGGVHTVNGAVSGLQVGVGTNAAGVINLSGGTLAAPALFLGGSATAAGGTGTLNLTGGALTVTNAVKVWTPTSRITINGGTLTAGGLVLPDWSNIAIRSGTLNLSKGSHVFPNMLRIGTTFDSQSGTATVNLTGGTFGTTGLNATLDLAHDYGHAIFNQSGGTNTVGSRMTLAFNTLTRASYSLTAGTLSTAEFLEVGADGHATYAQSGGAATIGGANGLIVGSNYPGYPDLPYGGTFTLSGGTFSAAAAQLGGFDKNRSGLGTVDVSGGSMTIAGAVKLWNANCSVTLNGGTLSAGSLVLPDWGRLKFNKGVMTLTGGSSANAGDLVIGAAAGPARVNLGAGSLSVAGTESLATAAGSVAVFNQTGGTHAANDLLLGGTYGPSGGTATVQLTGGTLTVSGVVTVWNETSAITVGGGTFSAASLNLPGGGPPSMLTLGGGGTWRHTGPIASVNHAFTVNANGGTIDVQSPAAVLTLGGVAAGAGMLNKSGPGTLRLSGSLAALAGLTVGAGKVDVAAAQVMKALTVNPGGTAIVSAGVLKVGNDVLAAPLAVSGSGKVDVGTRGLIVDVPAASEAAALAGVRGLIVSGYHAATPGGAGDWRGAGITSSAAVADPTRAVGYARASEVFDVTDASPDAFMGTAVDANAVVARLTLAGDANLDGGVNFKDLVLLAQNYNTTVSATTASWWFAGDFTFDGMTDFKDLVRLAQNYNAAAPGGPVPGAPAGFETDVRAAFAAVPEPGGLAVVAMAASRATCFRRRRRPRCSRRPSSSGPAA